MYKGKLRKDIDKCIDCRACRRVCPMMNRFKESPLELMQSLLSDNIDRGEVAYSCMLCDQCTRVCPKDINLKKTFGLIRDDLYKNEKQSHRKYKLNTIKTHQSLSFSKLVTTSDLKEGTKKVFIPGCSLVGHNADMVSKTMDYLNENVENIDILIRCCGKPSRDIGNVEGFENNMKNLNELIKTKNIEEIIVACENCYMTFKENLEGVKVISLWNLISEKGVPENIKGVYKGKEPYALHDPCPIKNEHEIHSSVRDILNQIGLNFEEFKFNKSRTRCCGSGGMVGVTNKDLYLEQKERRANETDLKNIVSYCQSCVNTLKLSGKNTLHILDFLFNDEVIKGDRLNGEEVGFLKSWSNRVMIKKKIKGEK